MTFVPTWSGLPFPHLLHLLPHHPPPAVHSTPALLPPCSSQNTPGHSLAHDICTHCSLCLDMSSPRFTQLIPSLPSGLCINNTFEPTHCHCSSLQQQQLPIPLPFNSPNIFPVPIWARYFSGFSEQISKQNRSLPSWGLHSSRRR